MQVVSFVGRLIELYILLPLEVISTILHLSATGVVLRYLHRDQVLAEEANRREALLVRYLPPKFFDKQRYLLFRYMSIWQQSYDFYCRKMRICYQRVHFHIPFFAEIQNFQADSSSCRKFVPYASWVDRTQTQKNNQSLRMIVPSFLRERSASKEQ